MDGFVCCITRRMPYHDTQNDIGTELSAQCKYGVIHSQMHRLSRRLCRAPLFCEATSQLLANNIQHGYNKVRPLGQRLSGALLHLCHGHQHPQARGHYEGKRRWLLNRIRHWQEHFL